MEYHKQVMENGTLLSRALEMSRTNVKEILDEVNGHTSSPSKTVFGSLRMYPYLFQFKSSTDEQKLMIFEVFDRVSRLQSLVVSEFSWLYTVFFYAACLIVVYLCTAAKRTADARLWLYLILTVRVD